MSDTPRVYSGRIVYMSLFLWALLLYQFYSASIVGSLLSEKPRFIKSIKDLAESTLEVGIEDMPYNHDFFRVNNLLLICGSRPLPLLKQPLLPLLLLMERKYKVARKLCYRCVPYADYDGQERH